MDSTPIPLLNTSLRIVGDPPMILSANYDPDQFWLPFMAGTVYYQSPEPEPKPSSGRKSNFSLWARVEGDDRKVHIYEADVEQRILRFHEHRRVGKKTRQQLASLNFPGWDKTSEGHCLRIIFSPGRKPEVDRWCDSEARGAFCMSKTSVVFEDAYDASVARLLFSAS